MTDNETYGIPAPEDPVIVVAEKIEFSYERTGNGDDLIVLLIHDPTAPVVVVLAVEQATTVAATLSTMLRPQQLDELRRAWLARNGNA